MGEQVASILAQTRPVDEIVVSDDASGDGTVEIVEALVAEAGDDAPALTVLRNDPPLGVVGNFAQAIHAATGDLIALSDQDDRWVPEKIAHLVAVFEARPQLTLVHTNARLVDASGAPLGLSLFEALGVTRDELAGERSGRAFDVLMRRNLVTGATTMFRASLRDIAEPFAPSWVHDEWLAILAAVTGDVDVVDAQLIDYRQHGGNAIGASKPGPRDLIARLREPRSPRNARLLARAEALVERLDHIAVLHPERVPAAHRDAARAKLAHERARSALPANRLRRIGPVLRAARAGDYSRYGRAKYDILRDLVQPNA